MRTYDPNVMMAKLAGEALGLGTGVMTVVFAAGESVPLVYGGLGATLVFTAVLVRQLSANQRVYLTIMERKDYERAYDAWQHRRERWDDAERLSEARWEAERLRYTYGERPLDPGPYVARPRPADLDVPPTPPGVPKEPAET